MQVLKVVPQLRQLVAGFPPRRPAFEPGSGHVGFVVDKVELGQVLSEYFGFPYLFYHLGLHNRPNGGHSTKWTQSRPMRIIITMQVPNVDD
jgi:hypothetical protein